MLSTTLVVYLDDLLLLGTRYATAEEQGQDDTNDLYRENHNYNNSNYIKGLYEVCVCVCVLTSRKPTMIPMTPAPMARARSALVFTLAQPWGRDTHDTQQA